MSLAHLHLVPQTGFAHWGSYYSSMLEDTFAENSVAPWPPTAVFGRHICRKFGLPVASHCSLPDADARSGHNEARFAPFETIYSSFESSRRALLHGTLQIA